MELLLVSPAWAQIKVLLLLEQIPQDTPPEAYIYLAGNFNDWNPADARYRFVPDETGRYRLEFSTALETALEAKLTLGNWKQTELDSLGNEKPNYRWNPREKSVYSLKVEAWRPLPPPTASPRVILDSVRIPGQGQYRTLRMYLPPAYATSQSRFPVMYMYDAQNLFDQATAFAGEWGVDEMLDSLTALQQIVVGIDNDGANRLHEYTAWTHSHYGGGGGGKHTDFIVRVVKPYVDKAYRTKKERQNTGIMGSSLGGLSAFYAALQYPKVFGQAGIFSPSFWFSDSVQVFAREKARQTAPRPRLYFLVGGQESETMVPDTEAIVAILEKEGYPSEHIRLKVNPRGQHNEAFWRKELAEAWTWLRKVARH
ncbi:MAG: alpha/beta hydrolase [Microscillaceae bacterium]|nr:alpha/beta hydrolase [Microscillaceae bacterium]